MRRGIEAQTRKGVQVTARDVLCGITYALSLVSEKFPALRHAFVDSADLEKMHANYSQKALEECAQTTSEERVLPKDLEARIKCHMFQWPSIRYPHPPNVVLQEKCDLFFTSHRGELHFFLAEKRGSAYSKVVHLVNLAGKFVDSKIAETFHILDHDYFAYVKGDEHETVPEERIVSCLLRAVPPTQGESDRSVTWCESKGKVFASRDLFRRVYLYHKTGRAQRKKIQFSGKVTLNRDGSGTVKFRRGTRQIQNYELLHFPPSPHLFQNPAAIHTEENLQNAITQHVTSPDVHGNTQDEAQTLIDTGETTFGQTFMPHLISFRDLTTSPDLSSSAAEPWLRNVPKRISTNSFAATNPFLLESAPDSDTFSVTQPGVDLNPFRCPPAATFTANPFLDEGDSDDATFDAFARTRV